MEVVALEGFTGFKTAAIEGLSDEVTVMDPFHVVRLGGDARRLPARHPARSPRPPPPRHRSPLPSPRTLHTGTDLLTDEQRARLEPLFADHEHVEVEATWAIYQRMISTYREPDPLKGRAVMEQLIAGISHGVPAALREVTRLGRALARRAANLLAHFTVPTCQRRANFDPLLPVEL